MGICSQETLRSSWRTRRALDKQLKDHAGKYVTGDEVSMADLFLAPQILAGIERFNVDMYAHTRGRFSHQLKGTRYKGNELKDLAIHQVGE
ncbi:hypothetical protein GOBAR_DD03407 [Gossypium barbadense]|nr:hypothetical protein GOBAR_DD03407 [Gossypium barbadense]